VPPVNPGTDRHLADGLRFVPVSEKTLTIVAAMARNRGIGIDGKMPWHLPNELRHFKATTLGRPIVMGRKTWESIGRPLPGRQNIVISRNREYAGEGFELCQSLDHALEISSGNEVMVIGGGELYKQALPMASRMVLTLVDCEPDADTFFPAWTAAEWQELSRRSVPADEANPIACEILELQRL
jgi:dihydrofolate reductase